MKTAIAILLAAALSSCITVTPNPDGTTTLILPPVPQEAPGK